METKGGVTRSRDSKDFFEEKQLVTLRPNTRWRAIAAHANLLRLMPRTDVHWTNSLGRAVASTLALRHQAWLRTSGFTVDVQANLMDMPFDGTRLFDEKAGSVLDRFMDSWTTAKSLGFSATPHPQSAFHPFCGYGTNVALYQPYASHCPAPPPQAVQGHGHGAFRRRGCVGQNLSATQPLQLQPPVWLYRTMLAQLEGEYTIISTGCP
ncbi:hypothetical protein NDU88_001968 [Pleurodeles waltl]|uniref:Uncharacterized protein n=1 Tax=Pleurodeles waltl TaxID=8319 RepID=A0AAV7WMF8_PLEWA|nr:hypothetical protein NDU88_001968 [Pleurodeles waltl]